MALEDIVYSEGDKQDFIVEENRGNVGAVEDVLTEGGSNSGMLVNEIPEKSGAGESNYTFS